ncbi:signal transduction histidine kinase [Mucilaginibacter sp. UYP25]|uniref:sensor histidine kinase n=1 Tax=unclassified Mucilaginibacter TaxID=2617802 RepID=UPI00339763C0
MRSLLDLFPATVTNAGKPTPDAIREKLFRPFLRGNECGNEGLGLGLYIASEIARAHGGMLGVHSREEETTFTFTMPIK